MLLIPDREVAILNEKCSRASPYDICRAPFLLCLPDAARALPGAPQRKVRIWGRAERHSQEPDKLGPAAAHAPAQHQTSSSSAAGPREIAGQGAELDGGGRTKEKTALMAAPDANR